MKVLAYLYDAEGNDKKVDLDANVLNGLNDKQLLWINILERDRDVIKSVADTLQLKCVPIEGILRVAERPKVFKYKDFYHFFIVSVDSDENGKLFPIPIDYLVGKNYVITVHDGDVNYLQEFGQHKKGENNIGELDAESFVATMLDLHIVSYFRALEDIEEIVDKMDDGILQKDWKDEDFLKQMVRLRGDVSKLRRWFLPHRDVFYALSRPDFKRISESEDAELFQTLNQHFETAVNAIESSRDTVLSLFDLYTTKTSHRMNNTMKRLTFITLMVGGMGVVAGVLGMNFEEEFFKSSIGFWIAISLMIASTGGLTLLAWMKDWI